MSTVSSTRSEFWTEHFAKLAKTESARNEQLDFSNHALVVQNYAYMLEACGSLAGKTVLDVGFGTGDLTRTYDLMGGTVSAFDMVKNRIPLLRELGPEIAWWQGDLSEWTLPANMEKFDIISACESLQYVEFDDAVARLLDAINSEGRLVILIPNADCPIVQRTSERFAHQYVGVSMKSLPSRLQILTLENHVSFRGIYFQDDQTMAPYESGPWIPIQQDDLPSSSLPSLSLPSSSFHSDQQLRGPHTINRGTLQREEMKPANRVQIVISRRNDKQV